MGNGRPKVKNLKSKVESYKKPAHVDAMELNFYGKVVDTKLQELMDSRMIKEDKAMIANLSTKPINRTFMANRFMESLGKCDEVMDV